ncbi:MAG TPA: RNA polymerase sigma factor [Thermomicrobiales bacterium]|jgi:RNA polymerase sigma-70 factor (ECF subfamily)|nr:RNA polymerase sigma factor [Thermomicrobiales bacterium]
MPTATSDGPPGGTDPPDRVSSADEEEAAMLRAQADPRHFEPIYRRYHRPVFAFCYRRLGDTDRAADATGQIFTRALAGIHGFWSGSVAAWLFTIARNTVIDLTRTHHALVPLDDAAPLVAAAPAPDEKVIADDQRAQLRAAMTHLSPDQRAIVELRWAGLTGPEIAQTLGLSLPATKSAQLRAYTRLRALLGPGFLCGDDR